MQSVQVKILVPYTSTHLLKTVLETPLVTVCKSPDGAVSCAVDSQHQ